MNTELQNLIEQWKSRVKTLESLLKDEDIDDDTLERLTAKLGTTRAMLFEVQRALVATEE